MSATIGLAEPTSAEILSASGSLAEAIPGFAVRAAQQEMASAIESALASRTSLIAEAGTGTGKTFAYLVPALLSAGRVIISTGTRNLQDQLFHRDLPQVRRALGVSGVMAQLKGRSNYLCWYRLSRTESDGHLSSRQEASELVTLREWGEVSTTGDVSELDEISESSSIWGQVTSTADNCLGQECPDHRNCFLLAARKRAQEADLVVVNHHLLCADLGLKDAGFGELLPEADAIIVDEAHQLPEIASLFFGESVSSRQLQELARDATAESLKTAAENRDVMDLSDQMQRSLYDLRLAFGRQPVRGAWSEMARFEHVERSLQALMKHLGALGDALDIISERSKGLLTCRRRSAELLSALQRLSDQDDQESVRWFETYRRSVVFQRTPLDIAEPFRKRMDEQGGSWVFTSATLTVADKFDHFQQRLGLHDVVGQAWVSPFDFSQQSCLYLPQGLPDPNTSDYIDAVMSVMFDVLQASGGRAFLLFTSHRAVQSAAEWLHGKLTYPLLVQGDSPRTQLLDKFRAAGNAVLLGTSSFWEGVDVRGEALSCVMIDKLPFAVPDDPVLKARMDACRRSGGNPFMDFQLPSAVISLKQGVGRLIRDVEDTGVLVLCDPRLRSKSYGRIFLRSLPPMPVTHDISDVEAFFDAQPVSD
ncbi:MAG TPA: ATP-dependent DNA helicase [Chromatiales bacterium]|jgi:ATP-dependent DNA helicase DinG|nr:ATP-dependent DNA helicase [Chromatiaceae bacterium]HIN82668.1 ATP-dependent DNA helicase [Chromatiales bacterium]